MPRFSTMIVADKPPMFRSVTTDAIVIRRERMGEYHKSLLLLTSDLGLITASAFGAYKMQSRLRMGSEPFTYSRVSLYHNPVKKTYKVTELDVQESFERLQEELPRISAVSLWAEIVRKSFGAGDTSDALFSLFLGCLRRIESSDSPDVPYVTSQFLWRFLSLAGYRPDTGVCDRCGRRFGRSEGVSYEPSANGFFCGSCAGFSSLKVQPGVLRYLDATASILLDRAMDVRLDAPSLAGLEELQFHAIRAVLEAEPAPYRFVRAAT
jgi:DNA repair protein RecO (recombination protein O)